MSGLDRSCWLRRLVRRDFNFMNTSNMSVFSCVGLQIAECSSNTFELVHMVSIETILTAVGQI